MFNFFRKKRPSKYCNTYEIKLNQRSYTLPPNVKLQKSKDGKLMWQMLKTKTHKNNLLITGSYDSTIKLWNTNTFECVKSLEAHKDEILCLLVLPCNHELASGARDNTIKVWSLTKYKLIYTLRGHTKAVSCLIWLKLRDELVSGSHDGTIKFWNLTKRVCTRTLLHKSDGLKAPFWIGCLLYLPTTNELLSSAYNSVNIWRNVEQCVKIFHINDISLECLILLPTTGHVASSSWDRDNNINIWNVNTWTSLFSLVGHRASVNSLILFGTNELISCSYDKNIKIWDYERRVCLKTLRYGDFLNVRLYHDWITCIILLPLRDTLLSDSSESSIKVWHVNNTNKKSKCLSRVNESQKKLCGHIMPVICMETCSF